MKSLISLVIAFTTFGVSAVAVAGGTPAPTSGTGAGAHGEVTGSPWACPQNDTAKDSSGISMTGKLVSGSVPTADANNGLVNCNYSLDGTTGTAQWTDTYGVNTTVAVGDYRCVAINVNFFGIAIVSVSCHLRANKSLGCPGSVGLGAPLAVSGYQVGYGTPGDNSTGGSAAHIDLNGSFIGNFNGGSSNGLWCQFKASDGTGYYALQTCESVLGFTAGHSVATALANNAVTCIESDSN